MMVSASAMALYSTSPPSFSTTRHVVAHSAPSVELDFGRRGLASHPRAARGGLSSLFGKGSQSHDCATLSTSQGSGDFRGDIGVGGGRAGGCCPAVNIPASSSSHLKERSPASVLLGVSSGRSSSSSPLGARMAWENSGSIGLPASEIMSTSARRRSSMSTDQTQPRSRSVGFQLGGDGGDSLPSESRALAAPSKGYVTSFSPLGADRVEGLNADIELQLRADDVFSHTELGTGFEALGAQLDTSSHLVGLETRVDSWNYLTTQDRMLRMVESSQDIPTLAESPPRNPGVSLSADEEYGQYLVDAQAKHPMFHDPLVKKAFSVAAAAHQGQIRKDGSPYISHCVGTALILAEVFQDNELVAAGLLHDTLDDSAMTEERLVESIGKDVANLVVGVSKVSNVSQLARDYHIAYSHVNADKLSDMVIAMGDVRVVLVKLADRIHNLRTLAALSPAKQRGLAQETRDVFAPLANRLGISSWKGEIEDTCFKYLEPQEYQRLEKAAAEARSDAAVRSVLDALEAAMEEADIGERDLTGRHKNLYSIHKKMQKKKRSIEGISDLRGLRLIVSDKTSCYRALEVVHAMWPSVGEGHSKDYIKSPKENGYQSLHTVVKGPDGVHVEIQIRTADMHHQAELGMAAHWRYKEGEKQHSKSTVQKVEWARIMLAWSTEINDHKLRAVSGRPQPKPLCPFPHHLEGCPYANGSAACAAPSLEDEHDPVAFVFVDEDEVSLRELPARSTVADVIRMCVEADSSHKSSSKREVRVMVHDKVAEATQVVRAGDVLKLVRVAVKPQPPLVHSDPEPWRTIGLDEFAVERERQRLAKWFSSESRKESNEPTTPTTPSERARSVVKV
eukprot:jgi/Mesen1/6731/ME000344S06006